jgi:hypothetical protein
MSQYLELTDAQLMNLTVSELEEAKEEFIGSENLGQYVDKYNVVVNTLAEKQAAQVKQERITSAITETATVVDNLEIAPGMLLRDMCIDEESYQMVKIAIQTTMNEKDSNYIEEITASAEREVNLNFQLKQRDSLIEQRDAKIASLQDKINALEEQVKIIPVIEFERDEALKVRDNAANEMDGLKLMLDEKQKQIDTLRNEIAVGAKGAVKIDQTEQLRLAQEAWKASRIKVTNIRWTDSLRKIDYAAELVGDYEGIGQDGQTITFNRLEKGKYLEVTVEEANRFRAEAAEALATSQANTIQDSPLVETPEIVTVEQFREEDTVRHDEGLDTSSVGEVAPQTLEEAFRRIEALEARVFEKSVGAA